MTGVQTCALPISKAAIDYTREDFTQNGKRYDIIFDTVGKCPFSRCENSLTQAGVYLATVPTPATMLKVLTTSSSEGKKVRFAATGLRPAADKAKDLAFIAQLIEAGKLKAVIDRCYPLAEIAEAHSYVEKGHKRGNVVITIN